MNHCGVETVSDQFLDQSLRATLGAREDQGLTLLFIQQLPEDSQLLAGTYFVCL